MSREIVARDEVIIVRGRRLRIGKVLRPPKELARHTSMDTGKHETPGAETKDFITSTKASSMSFMLICVALARLLVTISLLDPCSNFNFRIPVGLSGWYIMVQTALADYSS